MDINNKSYISILKEFAGRLIDLTGIGIKVSEDIDVEGLLKFIDILLKIYDEMFNKNDVVSELISIINKGLIDTENEKFIDNIKNKIKTFEYDINTYDVSLIEEYTRKLEEINEIYEKQDNPPAM